MNFFCRRIFIAGITLHLVGCSYISPKFNLIEQRQQEYLHAQTAAPLHIPKGMNTTKIQASYPVPEVTTSAPKQPSLLPPNSLAAQINQSKTSIDAPQPQATRALTTGPAQSTVSSYVNNDTLIINQPITTVWNQTETALDTTGYKIAFKNPKTLTYYIVDTNNSHGKITRESPIYQIHLRQIPLGVEISVSDNMGKRVDLATTNHILDNLYNQLAVAPTALNARPVTQGVTPDSAPTSNFGQAMRKFFSF